MLKAIRMKYILLIIYNIQSLLTKKIRGVLGMIKNVSSSKPLYEKIYEYVCEKIQNGEYKVGDRIVEEDLSKKMGVSRTPIREALAHLSSQGIIEKIPRRGFFISAVDKNKKNEIYQVIGHLEKLAVSTSINLLTEEDYNKLREVIAKMDIAIKFKNFSDYTKAQKEFHEIICRCDNQTLMDLINSLKISHIPQTYIGSDEKLFKSFEYCNEEHKQILEALIDKDLVKLFKLIDEHWQIKFENLV